GSFYHALRSDILSPDADASASSSTTASIAVALTSLMISPSLPAPGRSAGANDRHPEPMRRPKDVESCRGISQHANSRSRAPSTSLGMTDGSCKGHRHFHHRDLNRGSSTAYSTSTTRLTTTKIAAITSVTLCTTG